MNELNSITSGLILGYSFITIVCLVAVRFRLGRNRFFDYSGLEFIFQKFIPPKNADGKLNSLPTGVIWAIGIYAAIFGITLQRYEHKVDILEHRYTVFITNVSSGAPFVGRRLADIENSPCPEKPELLRPLSVLKSMLGVTSPFPDFEGLLVQTVEDWKTKLQNADLSEVDLAGANLNHADLRSANFRGTNLSKSDMQGAYLAEAIFIEADLSGANLSKADLKRAELGWAKLVGADLRGAQLSAANLSRADLRNSNLSWPDLSEMDIYRSELRKLDDESAPDYEFSVPGAPQIAVTVAESSIESEIEGGNCYSRYREGANLGESNLYMVDLSQADLRGARFFRANLKGANLTEANLSGSILKQADLEKANLSQAKLIQANLNQADLKKANLKSTDLMDSCIKQADLENANLSNAKLEKANLYQAVLVSAKLNHTDLSQSSLKQANLIGADLSNAKGLEFKQLLETSSLRWVNGIRPDYRAMLWKNKPDLFEGLGGDGGGF